jgi:hypothetical protein
MPIIMALLGGMLTVFFTYIMLVVRQAIMIVLVVVSPVAIALSILPGTKSIFDKWFKLFRGLLLTYPIASLLVMGGNFAARLVMKVWEGENFSMSVVAMAICVVPMTMLPQVTRSALASLDGLILKAQNGINKFANNRLRETKFANLSNTIKNEKTQRRRSFTYRGKDGNLHTLGEGIANSRLARKALSDDKRAALRSRLNSMRTAGMDRNLAGAQKTNSALNRFASYDNPDMIFARDNAKQVSEQAGIQESEGNTTATAELDNMMNILGSGTAQQTQAAVEHLLSQGEEGRNVLMQALSTSTPSEDNMRMVAQTIMNKGFGEMEAQNARLANWSRDIVNGASPMSVGNIRSYQLSGDALRRMTGRKLETQDTSEVQYLEGRIQSIRNGTAIEFTTPGTSQQVINDLNAGAANVKAAAQTYAASQAFRGAPNAKRSAVDNMRA